MIYKHRPITIRSNNGTNMSKAINNRSNNVSQLLKLHAITQKRNVVLSI
jgi:hypothetical protein